MKAPPLSRRLRALVQASMLHWAEPTTAQLSAGQTAWINDPMRLSSTLYRAMVAASPIAAKEDSQ